MSILFIGGNEPYYVEKACQVAMNLEELALSEINYLKTDSMGENVLSFLDTYPVMDSRKVVYCVVSDLSECNNPYYEKLCKELPDYATVVVRFRTYSTVTGFYKKLVKDKKVFLHNKDTYQNKLEGFLKRKAEWEPAALSEFLRRENYVEAEDVCLQTVMADADTLAIICKDRPISIKDVSDNVSDHCLGNVFVVAKFLRAGNIPALQKQASLLKGQEIQALTALLREYRVSYKLMYHSMKEVGVTYPSTFANVPKEKLIQSMDTIVSTLDALKNEAVPKSTALESTYLALAGILKAS